MKKKIFNKSFLSSEKESQFIFIYFKSINSIDSRIVNYLSIYFLSVHRQTFRPTHHFLV